MEEDQDCGVFKENGPKGNASIGGIVGVSVVFLEEVCGGGL